MSCLEAPRQACCSRERLDGAGQLFSLSFLGPLVMLCSAVSSSGIDGRVGGTGPTSFSLSCTNETRVFFLVVFFVFCFGSSIHPCPRNASVSRGRFRIETCLCLFFSLFWSIFEITAKFGDGVDGGIARRGCGRGGKRQGMREGRVGGWGSVGGAGAGG